MEERGLFFKCGGSENESSNAYENKVACNNANSHKVKIVSNEMVLNSTKTKPNQFDKHDSKLP